MDILATYSTDETLENEGAWHPLSVDSRILVARSGNEKYTELLRKKLKDAQLDLLPEQEANKLAEKIIIEVMAETILRGWEGFTEGGKEVPYSTAKAAEYLKVKDFRKKVAALSENFESYRAKAEEAQGNA